MKFKCKMYNVENVKRIILLLQKISSSSILIDERFEFIEIFTVLLALKSQSFQHKKDILRRQ